jgi:hypothetical protein
MSSDSSFTAAEIAIALGAQRQAIQRALAMSPEAGTRIVRGNEAATWAVDSLPAAIRSKLDRRAKAKGYLSAEHLLSGPPRRFEARVPINQLCEQVQQRAMKLRDALALPLAEQGGGRKGAALAEIGLREYRRAFGFEIEDRHWRRLLSRTVERDAGDEQWARLELYVDERLRAPKPTSHTKGLSEKKLGLEAENILLAYAGQVRTASSPTAQEKALLWQCAFEQSAELAQNGIKARDARLAMRRALWKCGVTLAKNEVSMGQLWRVKEEAWRAAGSSISALKDRRSETSGNHRMPELTKRDIDLITAQAIRRGGRVSQAWREALETGELSPEVRSHYDGAYHASKSYVPRKIRDLITPDVRALHDIHHGPRRAELNGAYISRDWSGVSAGDWYCADDVTQNSYYYAPDEHGRLSLMRGQLLLMIDCRSTCILAFAFLDQRNYTAHAIRTLITHTADTHGLPRQGFYLERGIWATSRLLKGDSQISNEDLTWTESEGGLRELGLKFRHSKLPRSKPVERVIGALQNLLDGEPGDSGRDEVKQGFERMRERKRLVEAGHAPAEKFFYSYEQLTNRIAQMCDGYNADRNDGKMTGARTPIDAWQRYQSVPLVRLPAEARYLLAHHKRPLYVGRNGITLHFGKQTFNYRNEQTGRLIGRKVLAWFNPESSEILAVTDMNRENCFTIERNEDVPAMNASPEELNAAMASRDAHNGYLKHRYRTLARLPNLNFRPTLIDAETGNLGRTIEKQKGDLTTKRKERSERRESSRAVLNDIGYLPRVGTELTPEQIQAAKAVRAAREAFFKAQTP